MSDVLIDLKGVNAQMAKNNLAIGELRLSVMKLAVELTIIHQHEGRIDALGDEVFKR